MQRRAFICGLPGLALTAAERDFLRQTRPVASFSSRAMSRTRIRFAASSRMRRKRRAATAGCWSWSIRRADAFRLREPHWPRYPAARSFSKSRCDDREKAKTPPISARRRWRTISTNSASTPPARRCSTFRFRRGQHYRRQGLRRRGRAVIELGGAAAEGLLGGILPVMKHVPGHGRAMADSHLALPVVGTPLPELEAHDFAPFARCATCP